MGKCLIDVVDRSKWHSAHTHILVIHPDISNVTKDEPNSSESVYPVAPVVSLERCGNDIDQLTTIRYPCRIRREAWVFGKLRLLQYSVDKKPELQLNSSMAIHLAVVR